MAVSSKINPLFKDFARTQRRRLVIGTILMILRPGKVKVAEDPADEPIIELQPISEDGRVRLLF